VIPPEKEKEQVHHDHDGLIQAKAEQRNERNHYSKVKGNHTN